MDRSKVLVIDDDMMLLGLVEAVLSEKYEVSTVKSGKSAIDFLHREHPPDIILLDVAMPEQDGFETYEQIKKINGCEEIPIIFLTGKTDADAEIKGLKLGAWDYIHKPFNKEILLTRIEIYLERERKRLEEAKKKEEGIFSEKKLWEMKKILSETEFEVAQLLALGYTNEEIGEKLAYSYNYVKKVVSNVLGKLGEGRRNQVRDYFI
ncbi:DNA-binding response regulator [Anaerosporobacter sp.]|uniref:DNA-binding response regulator n=1 Tax=Anaerosporobacter sp. TaxID=1872529 RepID=UPI00286EDECF|nr:DNA-binding response regulator [Anaerosporobacter sp.]